MKKLFTLISFLALFSLIFIGCQSSEDITSPIGDLDKPGPLVWSAFPSGVTNNVVPLIAGQDYANPVGEVTITYVPGGSLKISYNLFSPECNLTEIHVDLAKTQSIYTSSNTTGLKVNSQGNPSIGQFDFSMENEEGFSLPYEIEFTSSELVEALGGSASGTILIGAHGVVCCPGEEGTGTPVYCPDLSAFAKYSSTGPVYTPNGTPPYAFGDLLLYDNNSVQVGSYPTFCIDLDRDIQDGLKDARFICTYGSELPADIGCITEFPGNLDVFNYFINNFAIGDLYNGDEIQADEFQAIIWKLLEDRPVPNNSNFSPNMTLVNALVAEILVAGEGFIPQCGDLVAIIVVDANNDYCADGDPERVGFGTGNQPLIFWKPVECEPLMGCETVWAIPLLNGMPNEDESNLYPGHVWFRYFGFSL